MKKMMIMAFLAVPTLLFASCKTAKPTGTSTTVRSTIHVQYVPQDVLDDKFQDGLVDYGYGRSGNKGKAYRDALRSAQLAAATRLYNTLSAVATDFNEDIDLGKKSQYMSKRTERAVNIIDNKVVTIRNSKEPEYSHDEEGVWECDVEIMIDYSLAKRVAKEIYNAMPEDDSLRVKFEEKEFIEEYEKQLRDFRNQKGGKGEDKAESETEEN